MLTKYQILGGGLSAATAAVGIYQGVKVLGTNKKSVTPKTEVLTNLPKDPTSESRTPIDVPEEEQPNKSPAPSVEPQEPKPDPHSNSVDHPPAPNNVAPKENTVSDGPESKKKQNEDSPDAKPPTEADPEEYGLFGNADAGGIGWQFKDFLNGSTKPET